MRDWQGMRVLVLGAARQGLAATRYLLRNGASVIINDQKSADEFHKIIQDFSNMAVQWEFGGHPLSLLQNVDLVIVSGGVPLDLPIIQKALHKGICVTNESQIFMETNSAKTIGITGSAGKSTTTILVGEIANTAVSTDQKVWVGGNIGLPLIDLLDQIKPIDWVVLELSSFQLELMNISPHVAAVLNITPNHLDRHASMEAYIKAKTRIFQFQNRNDWAVVNIDDPRVMNLRNSVVGKLITFGNSIPAQSQIGTFINQEEICLNVDGNKKDIMPVDEIKLRGQHNWLNALGACAIAYAAGFPENAMRKGIGAVTSIPHRLELVRDWKGTFWYNDSIATTPERSIAAIRSFNQPLLVLLGGRDKKLPWNELSNLVHERVKKIILFGEAADLISNALGEVEKNKLPESIIKCKDLKDGVQEAAKLASPGDVVLLAPGGTSFDEFRDFEERGQKFKEWVNSLP